ncbi:maltose operon periplasmic protein malM [Vibrio ishigakensis]|uniref:Maltose operon periplasmic protein malM n=1 Tax=Vibrio ishigakensis TaxID=1481914 RepID=A0A0B8NYD4_9VIBR|nr:MalM family protein [Vibrio ishigakensis]GAM56073.1 maltose operon periplasmic protein malM [Vibrio ishigakensis]
MKKIVLMVALSSALAGCASNVQVLDTSAAEDFSAVTIEQISQLNSQNVALPANLEFVINDQSPQLQQDSLTTNVASFSVPGNRGALKFEITSVATQTVYSPNVAIYSSTGELLFNYDADEFKYEYAKLIYPDRLEGEFIFSPPAGQEQLQVLIYTTAKDLAETTELLHPAKAFARSTGKVEPEIPNPIAAHADTGEFKIEITSQLGVTQPVEENVVRADQAGDSTTYYHSAIRQAVADNNMPKALALLEEAQDLGVKDAKKVYIEALEAR